MAWKRSTVGLLECLQKLTGPLLVDKCHFHTIPPMRNKKRFSISIDLVFVWIINLLISSGVYACRIEEMPSAHEMGL